MDYPREHDRSPLPEALPLPDIPYSFGEKVQKKYKLQAYALTRYEVQAVHGVGVGLEHVVADSLDEELVHLLRGGGDEAPEDVGKAVKDVTRSHQGVL